MHIPLPTFCAEDLLRKAYSSWARLTVPGQGLWFLGRAYGSRAGLTVSGHSDVPLSGLGRWMACPALLQKAGLGMPQYPVASQNAYTPARLLHSKAAAQILSQCRCNGGQALSFCTAELLRKLISRCRCNGGHKRSCCANSYRDAGATVGRLWAIWRSSLCDVGLRQAYLNIPMVRMGACCNAKPLLVHKRQRFVSQ